MKKPTKTDLLDEVARLQMENARLKKLVQARIPELTKLRYLHSRIGDLAANLPLQLEALQGLTEALLPKDNSDLPSVGEMRGILSEGRQRVYAALEECEAQKRPAPEE